MSTAANKKAFAFASQKKPAKPVAPQVIGSFVIGDDTFEIKAVKDAATLYLVADMSEEDGSKSIAALVNYVHDSLTEESGALFRKVALGRGDYPGLEASDVTEVFEYILEVQSEVPTGQPSASSARRRTTGSASGAKQA